MLSTATVNILKQKWNLLDAATLNEIQNLTYDDYPTKTTNLSLKKMLMVLVNNLLIKGNTGKSNNDFIVGIADVAKKQYINEFKLNDSGSGGQGGDPRLAIKILLETLFDPITDFNILDLDKTAIYYNNAVDEYNSKINI
jgi:hypothetical protein